MAIENNKRKFKNPEPIIPGRAFDYQAGPNVVDRRTYQLLRELEDNKAEIGDITLTDIADGDLLVYNAAAAKWVNQQFTPASLGVGTSGPTSYRLEVDDGGVSMVFTATPNPLSSLEGLHLIRPATANTYSHGISLDTGSFGDPGWGQWEWGLDFDVDGDGLADLVPANDGTANANAGADVCRVSHEAHSNNAATCKWVFGRLVGTPRNNTEFFLINGGDDAVDLSGLTVRHWASSGSTNGLNFVNRHASKKICRFNWNNQWVEGVAIAGGSDSDWSLFDSVNSKTRLYVKNSSATNPLFGVGTTNPAGMVSATGGSGVTTAQVYFCGSTTDDPGNRAVNIEGIRDATVANTVNYVLLMGRLGGSATAGTRNLTSSGSSFGFEASDTALAVVMAGTGSNQTIVRSMSWSNTGQITLTDAINIALGTTTGTQIGTSSSQKLAVLGAAPIARPGAYTLTGSATRTMPTDPSGAYTGIDNAQAGTVYATVADLNTLRGVVSSLLGVQRQHLTDMGSTSGFGWLNA